MADYDRSGSLQELEPSPVDETPSGTTADSYFPGSTSSSSSTSNTLGLSFSGHSSIYYLSRLQKYSSYVFTAYAAAHIANTSIIPLITRSVPESERYVLLTRPYYQGIPFEPLLIVVPLWTHVLSGVALRVVRRNLNARRYGATERQDKPSFLSAQFWPRVSGISKLGFALAPLVVGHVFINRAIPQQFAGGQSNVNLSYVSHAFAKHPIISYAGFSALIAIGAWHMTWGWAKWMGWTPEQVTVAAGGEREIAKKRRWYVLNGLAAAMTALWMAGGFAVVGRGGPAPGYIGKLYDEMYRRIPMVGRWM